MTESNYKWLTFEVIVRIRESLDLKANSKDRKFPPGYGKYLPEKKLRICIFGYHGCILVYWEAYGFYTLLRWIKNSIFLPTLKIVPASAVDCGSISLPRAGGPQKPWVTLFKGGIWNESIFVTTSLLKKASVLIDLTNGQWKAKQSLLSAFK